MRQKYGNTKVVYDGHRFDSKAEAARYQELKLLQAAGKISGLQIHPKFQLVPKSKTRRAVTYTADFMYYEYPEEGYTGTGVIVEDVKSVATAKNKAYIVKRNLFEYQNQDIQFREVIL